MLDHLDSTIIRKEQIAAGRIFISYSRRNRDFARALYTKLKGMGFELWRDVHDIEAGAEDWWLSIQQAIRECETVILCMSLPALKSPVVGDEWAYARTQKKRIIPVVADDIWDHLEVKAGTFTIPNWMQRKNWLDFRSIAPEPGAAWANLIRTLNETYVGKRFITMADELPPRFVRRVEDIDRAVRGLVDDKNDAVAMTTALNGAGGYGKTTLAKAIARDVRIQGAFDDGILWVTLGEKLLELSGDGLTRALIDRAEDLIYALTEVRPNITTLEMARTELQAAISDLYILLVIDDVWDKAHLAPFLVKTTHAACLITTRSLDTIDRQDILRQTVDKMKPIEAVELLGAGFDTNEVKQNDAALRTLARDLREYPLVLALANTQIANYAHDMSLSLADSIALAYETLSELGVLGFDDTSSTDRNAAVNKTLDVSIRQITPAERQKLYRELAIFPEDALIPLAVLEKYWGLSKVGTLQFCQALYRKTALLHSFEGMAIRIHDVFRDCLLRAWDPDQIRALHRRLTDSWGVKTDAVVTSLPDSYCWNNLAYHLIAGGQTDLLRALLLEYRYLRAKLGATDANALQADCEALLKLGKDEPIRVLRSAISMSAHVLREDPDALGHQLVGRMMGHRKLNDELRAFTDSIPAQQPGLYPVEFDSDYVTHEQAGGYLLRTLAEHTDTVNGALVLADGRILSWSKDKTLRLWASDGALLTTLAGHMSSVTGALALNDGRFLSWSDDKTLRLWASDGALLTILAGHMSSVTGALALSDGRFLSWSYDETLRLWASDGALLTILTGHMSSVTGALVLNDGRFLSWSGHVYSSDHGLRLWETSGTLLAVLSGHTHWVIGVLVLTDGRFLSWSWDKTLRLWSSNGTPQSILTGHTDLVKGVLELSNGRFLSWSSDETLRLWAADGASLAELEGHTESVYGALELADGRILSWSEDQTLRLWAADGTPLTVLRGHTESVTGALELSNGHILSWGATLRLWIADGTEMILLQGHTSSVIGAAQLVDGNIISWSIDRSLRFWSMEGTPLNVLLGHSAIVNGTQALSNGRLLTWSYDSTLKIWNADGTSASILKGHSSIVEDVAVLGDGRILSCSVDGTLRLWSTGNTQPLVLEGHKGPVTGLLLLDSKRFLSWGHDRTLRIWDEDGTLLAVSGGQIGLIEGAAVTNDGRFLTWSLLLDHPLESLADKTLRLWSTEGRLLATLENVNWQDLPSIWQWAANNRFDPQVIFRLDKEKGRRTASRVIVLQQAETLKEMGRFNADSNITQPIYLGDGNTIAVGDDKGRVMFLRWRDR